MMHVANTVLEIEVSVQ